MILDILTVLFFVLGFAFILWMVGERRRDVLHYVTKSRAARGDVRDDRLDRLVARSDPVRGGRQRRTLPTNSRASSATSKGTRIRVVSRRRRGNDNEGAGYSYRSLFFDKCIRAECATQGRQQAAGAGPAERSDGLQTRRQGQGH
jgi:hypothetical protein